MARALRWCDHRTAVQPLAELLDDKFRDVQISSASALGELRGETAFQALEAKLRAGDAEVSVVGALVEALVKFGEAAGPSLAVAARDELDEVRTQVELSIRMLFEFSSIGQRVTALLDRIPTSWWQNMQSCD